MAEVMDTIYWPYSQELEQYVLGGLLAPSDLRIDYALVCDRLSVDDFYYERHAYIFMAIDHLHRSGHVVDVISVCEQLEAIGQLVSTGKSYINQLALSFCPQGDGTWHINKLQEKTKDRLLREVSYDIIESKTGVEDNVVFLQSRIDYINKLGYTNQSKDANYHKTEAMVSIETEMSGRLLGYPTGFLQLDGFSKGLQKGHLIVLAGRPGQGKSALSGNIMMNLAEKGVKTLFVSLEMMPHQITARLIKSKGRTSDLKILNQVVLPEGMHIVSLKNEQVTDIERILLTEKAGGISFDVVIVDFLQLLKGSGQNRTEQITEISRGLKKLALSHEITVIALSQLSREVERRQDKRPVLSDLRDSGSLEQDADQVWFIFRPAYYNPSAGDEVEIIIAKQRDGPTGVAYTRFISEFICFSDS